MGIISTGTGIGGAWVSWSPTWSNLTVGNGTVTALYAMVGKTVTLNIGFVLGSTSSVSTGPTFTLPVTAASRYSTGNTHVGGLYIEDAGVVGYVGHVLLSASTTAGLLQVFNASATTATASTITSTVPHAWGTADYFKGHITYEAA